MADFSGAFLLMLVDGKNKIKMPLDIEVSGHLSLLGLSLNRSAPAVYLKCMCGVG